MLKITQLAISQRLFNQNKKKFHANQIYIYLHLLCQFKTEKIKTQMAKNLCLTFLTSVKLALNGPANSSEVTYSKILNGLSRAP